MTTHVVDCRGIESQSQFWDRYLMAAQPLQASDFGRNLPPLWDALEGGGPGKPTIPRLRLELARFLESLDSGRFLKELQMIASELTRVELAIEL